MSGIVQLVHRADDPDGPFKTIGEVAEYFEVHVDTVRRWVDACGLKTKRMELSEKSFVWVYNDVDLEVLSEYSANLKPGPRPKQDQ